MVHVAVAVLIDASGKILLQRRADDAHQGGLWEFPGGKVEAGETVQQALYREIIEELGIKITASQSLIKIRHDYGDRAVLLDVYLVSDWQGDVIGAEGQPLAWVSETELDQYAMPAADKPIVTAIKLPRSYIITPPKITDAEAFIENFERLLKQGERLFLYRIFDLQGISHAELLLKMQKHSAAYVAKILIHDNCDCSLKADGRHYPESELNKSGLTLLKFRSVSCHSLDALKAAEANGFDFLVLSPVKKTTSHPEAKPMGWQQFAELVDQVNLPVYALGGMTAEDIETAINHGAQGVAGISGWWDEAISR